MDVLTIEYKHYNPRVYSEDLEIEIKGKYDKLTEEEFDKLVATFKRKLFT